MLADMRFVGMIAHQLDVIEAIERPVEATPEVDVAQDRLLLQAVARQRLEMRLADQPGAIALPA